MGKLAIQYAKLQETKRNSPLRIQRKKSSQLIKSPADRILFLQRTIGNQAVQRLIKSGTLQAKLNIGQPGDRYEQEADRVADAVMRMPEPGVQRQVEPEEEEEETLQTKPLASQITPLVQVQRQEEPEEEEEEKQIQPKSNTGMAPQVTPGIAHDIHSLKGTGQPLPASERTFFEPRFGVDFGNVRVHSDTQAAHTARSVNARAFTNGRDVVFEAGQYSPGAISGRKLLAHELTHVVQQNGQNPFVIQRGQPSDVPSDVEEEFERAGQRFRRKRRRELYKIIAGMRSRTKGPPGSSLTLNKPYYISFVHDAPPAKPDHSLSNPGPPGGKRRGGATLARLQPNMTVAWDDLPSVQEGGVTKVPLYLQAANIYFTLQPIKVYVSSDYAVGSCPYGVFFRHEDSHAQAFINIFLKHRATMVAKANAINLPTMKSPDTVPQTDITRTQAKYEKPLVQAVKQVQIIIRTEMEADRNAKDTPMAYQKEYAKCPASDWRKRRER